VRAVHHAVRITSQVGQNNSFPWHTDHGTFYKVCRGSTAPVHAYGRIKDAHRTPAPSDPNHGPEPILTLALTRSPLPRVKSPEPRAKSPHLSPLTSRSKSSSSPKF
jgi:hypothetical protein